MNIYRPLDKECFVGSVVHPGAVSVNGSDWAVASRMLGGHHFSMIEFRSGSEIGAPIPHVWGHLADVERWPEWAESFTIVKRLDNTPLGVGAQVKIKQPKLLPGIWTVTDWQPQHSFSWAMKGAGVRVAADHWLEEAEQGCAFRQRMQFEGLIGEITGRLWRSLVNRYMEMEANGLKAISEETFRGE